MNIEKLILAVEHNLSVSNMCYGTQQISNPNYKELKQCFLGKLMKDYTVRCVYYQRDKNNTCTYNPFGRDKNVSNSK